MLADYNLPNGITAFNLLHSFREKSSAPDPVVILTGDISTSTLRDIALQDCVQLNKPVRSPTDTGDPTPPSSAPNCRAVRPTPTLATSAKVPPAIYVVDDDSHIREGLRACLRRRSGRRGLRVLRRIPGS